MATTQQINQREKARNEIRKLIDQHIKEWRQGEKHGKAGAQQYACGQRARALEELKDEFERLRLDMIDE